MLSKEELIISLSDTASHLAEVLNKFNGQNINTVPFLGSWTAAQVADHITQSNMSIIRALILKGTKINRDPGEKIPELKEVFLDFTTKLQSPGFILPTQETYERTMLLALLAHSITKIKETAKQADLSEMIRHPAFGDITKFEILHFVLYHTQRHIHQLENILREINKK